MPSVRDRFFQMLQGGAQMGGQAAIKRISDEDELTRMLRGKEADATAQEAARAAEAPGKKRALDIQGQNAQTNEQYRKDQAHNMNEQREMERQRLRAEILKSMGQSGQKPLSVEQEKSEVLSKEGLATAARLKDMQGANPNTTRAVLAAEKARSIPLVGNMAGDAITGLASFFEPKAKQIEADREKLARDMVYLKSGASATENEVQGTRRQLPGIATDAEEADSLYDQFSNPFKQTIGLHERKTAAPQYSPEQAVAIVEGRAPMPSGGPAAPAAPAVDPIAAKKARLEALKRKAGQ